MLFINRRFLGKIRAAAAGELIHNLRTPSGLAAHILGAPGAVDLGVIQPYNQRLRRVQMPMAGGSAQFVTVTGTTSALINAQALQQGPIVGLDQAPFVLAISMIPSITTATAATIITTNLNRTDTPAVFGGTASLMPTGGTAPGALVTMGIVPFGIPATNGVSLSAAASGAAGGVVTGSATQPTILAIVGIQ